MATNTPQYPLLIAACALCLAANAVAVELINSEAEFLSAAPIVSTEKFERDVDLEKFYEPTIVIDDVIYEISTGRAANCFKSAIGHCWSIEKQERANQFSSGATNAIGVSEWALGAGDWDIIHFGERRNVRAFGFYLQASIEFVPDGFAGWEILVHESDGSVTSFDVPTKAAKKPLYFGFVSDIGISKIDVGSKPGQMGMNWDYMLVTRSEIVETPESEAAPTTIADVPAEPEGPMIDNDDIQLRDALYYEGRSKTPATGTVIARYADGKKHAQLGVRAGKAHGLHVYWHHANGEMKSRGRYVDGRRHGLFEYWHENGELSSTVNYSYGRTVGPASWWYESGQREIEKVYREGRMEGLEQRWYADGQLQSEANFVNGGIEGIYTQWYPDGGKKAEATFVNGKQHGPVTEWHEGGQVKAQLSLVNGEREGTGTSWYANGQKEYEQSFENGKRVGVQRKWYEDGSLKAEISFVDDKMHGRTTWWYQDGQKEIELNFKEGQMHGRGTFWYSNGQMQSDGEFKNGKVVGRHSFWDENGKKLRRRPRDYPSIPEDSDLG